MMAGDWIKMRIDLQTHPKVVRILSATGSDKFRVVGGLHSVWSVFDTHSADGKLDGYTPESLDHIIGWPGFAKAMIAVGWLVFDGAQLLVLPEFSEHNGKSGKRRAEDQKRKRNDRKSPQSVRNLSAVDADKNLTREEKRREEDTNTDSGSAYTTYSVSVGDAPPVPLAQPSPDAIPTTPPTLGKPSRPEDPAVQISASLRRMGINANSVHPDVQAWAAQGIDMRYIAEAADMAKMRKPGEPISVGYLSKIVADLVRKAAKTTVAPVGNLKFNFDGIDRSSDLAAAEQTIARHGIVIPEGDIEI
jgi:hypothetical protein